MNDLQFPGSAREPYTRRSIVLPGYQWHVALSPLAKQHRIVAKVNELMALCDRLETGLADTDTVRPRLLESLLHAALDENA